MTLWYDVVGTSPLVSYVTTYSNVTSDEAIVWRNNGYGGKGICIFLWYINLTRIPFNRAPEVLDLPLWPASHHL